jgi:hypothetical protein
MKALNKYLKEKNAWRKLFGERDLTMPEDCVEILNMLDCDASPENLCMDGEASMRFIREQKAFLDAVRQDIEDNFEPTI